MIYWIDKIRVVLEADDDKIHTFGLINPWGSKFELFKTDASKYFPSLQNFKLSKTLPDPKWREKDVFSPKLSPSCFFWLFILSNDVIKFIGYFLFFFNSFPDTLVLEFLWGLQLFNQSFSFDNIRIYFFLIKISSRFACLLELYIYLIN